MKNIFTRFNLALTILFLACNYAFAQPTANFTSNITSACSPAIVNFTSTSTGNPTSYSWDFGDAGTSTLQNPSHSYNDPGVYTVTLTVSNGIGSDTETKTNYITVWRNPTASFSVSEDTVCSTASITFTSTSTPGDATINQYNWTFNDGTPPVSGVSTLSHQFIFSGSSMQVYYPNLIINDANGCNSDISDTIYVFPEPIASFSASPTGSCNAPATISFTNNSQFTNQYTWDFGDTASGANNTSTLQNPSHTFNGIGSFNVTLTAGVSGCSSTTTSVINISNPVADFTASDTVVCLGDAITFSNLSTSGNYLWDFDDPLSGGSNTSTLTDPSHTFIAAGTHDVTLQVSVGGCLEVIIKRITVRQLPVLSVSAPATQACDTSFTVSFSDTSSTNVAWTWNFGDPGSGSQNTSTQQNPTHTFNNFGLYSITHTVTDAFGCTDSATLINYIRIVPPTIDFTETDSGCVGSTFTFNAQVSSPADPVITNYSWRFGDGTGLHDGGTSPTIDHTFNTVGIFPVTLIVTTSTGCTATLIKQNYILIGTPPAANFSATPLSICFDENVQFTDLTPSPVTGWQWSFGDGGGSTSQNPNHQYKLDTSGTADPFDVQLIAYYNGCPDTIDMQDLITVLGPIPNYSIQYNCPSPYLVAFTNLSGGATSYSWDFGDSSPLSTQTDPTHTYANRGDYQVVLTATSTVTGCTIDTVYTVRVRDPLALIVTDTTIACRPGVINYTGSGSTDAISYLWHFNDPGSIRDSSLFADTLHLYSSTGFFDAQLTVTDIHGCTNTATQQVHIIGPSAGFTASPFTGCAPITVTFTDTSKTEGGAIAQWTWNYGSITRTITTPPGTDTLTYSVPGNYTVILTVTDVNGCSNSVTATNYIRPTKPVPVIIPPDSSCRNVEQTFTVNPGPFVASPVTYTWDFGDGTGTTGTTNPVNHTYPDNGSYPLRVIVTDGNGCVDSTTSNIFIYTTPAAFSTTYYNDTCVNQGAFKQAQIQTTFTIDDNSYVTRSPATYIWDFTESTAQHLSLSSASHNFYSTGNYGIGLIVINDFGCSDTVYKPDLVNLGGPTGSLTFTPDSGCRPLTVNFQGSGDNFNYYAWDFGDGNVIPNTQDSTLSHTYTSVGVFKPVLYQAYLFDTLNNEVCLIKVATNDTIVTVTSLGGIDILEDSIYVTDGERDTLHVFATNPSSQPLTYVWTPSGYVLPDVGNDSIFYATTNGTDTYYYVDVVYGITGCSGRDSVLVLYRPCEGDFKIPNVFTPNADSKNDTYHIDELCDYEGFHFIIYNRWGKIIFESTDADFHWDGKTNGGTEASEGVYYYVLLTKTKEVNGYIQLIRE